MYIVAWAGQGEGEKGLALVQHFPFTSLMLKDWAEREGTKPEPEPEPVSGFESEEEDPVIRIEREYRAERAVLAARRLPYPRVPESRVTKREPDQCPACAYRPPAEPCPTDFQRRGAEDWRCVVSGPATNEPFLHCQEGILCPNCAALFIVCEGCKALTLSMGYTPADCTRTPVYGVSLPLQVAPQEEHADYHAALEQALLCHTSLPEALIRETHSYLWASHYYKDFMSGLLEDSTMWWLCPMCGKMQDSQAD